MQVNGIAFGQLIKSDMLINRLKELPKDSRLTQDCENLIKYVEHNKLDKKRYVDVKLALSHRDSVIVIAFPKKGDVPMNPDVDHYIDFTKKGFVKFKKWVNSWDYSYSPAAQRKWEYFNSKMAQWIDKK